MIVTPPAQTEKGLVTVEDASFGYGGKAVVSVDHIEILPGRCISVYGPNGSGKTTFVRGVAGLLPPLSGTVRHATGLRIGYLPQQRSLDLHWPMTGFDAAALAISASAPIGRISRLSKGRIRESMDALNVVDLADRHFSRLSGGQQQRVLLAGTLAADPQVLVLDEPTDGLDAHSRQLLLDNLHSAKAGGLALVVISHDVEDVVMLSDQVGRMMPGDCDQTAETAALTAPPTQVRLMNPHQFAAQLTSQAQR